MTTPRAPNGDETHVRAVVFREGDIHVAQCLEYNVIAQGEDVEDALENLALTLEAEFELAAEQGKRLCDLVIPAQNYFHELFDKGAYTITPASIAVPFSEMKLAKAA